MLAARDGDRSGSDATTAGRFRLAMDSPVSNAAAKAANNADSMKRLLDVLRLRLIMSYNRDGGANSRHFELATDYMASIYER
jgi:hypothetical protein